MLEEKGISLNLDQVSSSLKSIYETLVEWNEKMNLTAITEKEEVYLKHFFDSVTAQLFILILRNQSSIVMLEQELDSRASR